jgi:hypothetical protein
MDTKIVGIGGVIAVAIIAAVMVLFPPQTDTLSTEQECDIDRYTLDATLLMREYNDAIVEAADTPSYRLSQVIDKIEWIQTRWDALEAPSCEPKLVEAKTLVSESMDYGMDGLSDIIDGNEIGATLRIDVATSKLDEAGDLFEGV